MQTKQLAAFFYKDSTSKDYIIRISGTDRRLEVHRNLLCHFSKYFETQLNHDKANKKDANEMIISKEEEPTMRAVVDFVYAQLKFRSADISKIFSAADYYQIDEMFIWLFEHMLDILYKDSTFGLNVPHLLVPLLDRFLQIAYRRKTEEGSFLYIRPTSFLFTMCDQIFIHTDSIRQTARSEQYVSPERSMWLMLVVFKVIKLRGYSVGATRNRDAQYLREFWHYIPDSYDMKLTDEAVGSKAITHDKGTERYIINQDAFLHEARFAICHEWNQREVEARYNDNRKQYYPWTSLKSFGERRSAISNHFSDKFSCLPAAAEPIKTKPPPTTVKKIALPPMKRIRAEDGIASNPKTAKTAKRKLSFEVREEEDEEYVPESSNDELPEEPDEPNELDDDDIDYEGGEPREEDCVTDPFVDDRHHGGYDDGPEVEAHDSQENEVNEEAEKHEETDDADVKE